MIVNPAMRIDPALAARLTSDCVLTPPNLASMPPGLAIAALRAAKAPPVIPPHETAAVEDRQVTGLDGNQIPVRIYRPPGTGLLPVMLHLHGGGWVGGGIGNDELRCHVTSRRAGIIIVSVDYRLAPEHKFPAGLNDAQAVLEWLGANAAALGADPARIAIGGSSAGANIAAAITLRLLAQGAAQPKCQILAYPVCDTSLSQPSHFENAAAPLLSTAMMDWFIGQYLPAGMDRADPLVAVLRAKTLEGLPPTLIITADCDPLRDEGAQYAAKLRAAGVFVEHENYAGMVHGFLTRAPDLPQSVAAMAQTVQFIRRFLSSANM